MPSRRNGASYPGSLKSRSGLDWKTEYAGLMDQFRIPEFVYYFYQSQRDPHEHQPGVASGPMLHVAHWWTGPPYTVTVPNTAAGFHQWKYDGSWQGTKGDNASSYVSGDTAVLEFNGVAHAAT